MATEKIFIQIGEDKIELTGADKEAFLADREQMQEAQRLLEAEQAAKQEARTSALTKLATIAGLNEEEMTALGL
jgi:phosphotransferase system IIA component